MAFTLGVSSAQSLAGRTQEEIALVVKEAEGGILTVEEQGAIGGISILEKETILASVQSQSPIPPDAFDPITQEQNRQGNQGEKEKRGVVGRREAAYRGITPKDESIASLRIIANLDLLTGQVNQTGLQTGGLTIYGTDQFILQNVAEPDDEKVQIVETFGEPIAFFYGRRPRMYTYSGILLNGSDSIPNQGKGLSEDEKRNTYSTLWRDNFKMAYELFLRGTKAARFRARAYLTYDRVVREGFIIRSNISQDIRPGMVNFMFSMFVTREVSLDGVRAIESNTDRGVVKAPALDEATVFSNIDVQFFKSLQAQAFVNLQRLFE